MKRVGRFPACANTGSGPVSIPRVADTDRCATARRVDAQLALDQAADAGSLMAVQVAQPPGGNATLSPRHSSSPSGKVSSRAAEPLARDRARAVAPGARRAGRRDPSARPSRRLRPAPSQRPRRPGLALRDRTRADLDAPRTTYSMRGSAGRLSTPRSVRKSSQSRSTGCIGPRRACAGRYSRPFDRAS